MIIDFFTGRLYDVGIERTGMQLQWMAAGEKEKHKRTKWEDNGNYEALV